MGSDARRYDTAGSGAGGGGRQASRSSTLARSTAAHVCQHARVDPARVEQARLEPVHVAADLRPLRLRQPEALDDRLDDLVPADSAPHPQLEERRLAGGPGGEARRELRLGLAGRGRDEEAVEQLGQLGSALAGAGQVLAARRAPRRGPSAPRSRRTG